MPGRVSVAGRSTVVVGTVAVLAGLPQRTDGWQALWLVAVFAGFGAVLAVGRAARWRSALTWALLGDGALLELADLPNRRTGGTILPRPVRDVAERSELALRHTAMPVIGPAIAVTVMMAACFASSRSTSGT